MPPSNEIKFAGLKINGWRQFGDINIELHPQLTVLTGSNGAGKSTLLNIFSSHFGYQRPYLATPYRDPTGGYRYMSGIFNLFRKIFTSSNPNPNIQQVGEISYTNGAHSVAHFPGQESIQYNLTIAQQQQVQGFHVPSHRRLSNYRQVNQIPTQPMLPQQAYDQFNGEITTDFQGGHTGFSSTYRIKEALLSMAVFGPGSKFIQQNDVVMSAFDGFTDILRKILPEEIGFIEISIRSPDVVLVTKTGDFLIDAASGGLMVLVDLAWQIYMFSLRFSSFVITIDEPENHLHPSMQRTLMSNLIKTFPQVQFIVATHSPFIVSAVREARVYVLRYQDRLDIPSNPRVSSKQTRFVNSVLLDSANRVGTASQILRDVLGLPTTYPEWVTQGMEEIIIKYQGRPFTEGLLKELREELTKSGYGDLYPDVLSKVVKQ